MRLSQAEMDLMRFGTDGDLDYRAMGEIDYYALGEKGIAICPGCGLVEDECECEVEG